MRAQEIHKLFRDWSQSYRAAQRTVQTNSILPPAGNCKPLEQEWLQHTHRPEQKVQGRTAHRQTYPSGSKPIGSHKTPGTLHILLLLCADFCTGSRATLAKEKITFPIQHGKKSCKNSEVLPEAAGDLPIDRIGLVPPQTFELRSLRLLRYDLARSKRSRFITLLHAAIKSCRNFSSESALP